MKKLACVLALAGAFASSNAFAWGGDGHRAVGAIADKLLKGTNAEKQIAALLLPGESLEAIANWPDCVKGTYCGPQSPEMVEYTTANPNSSNTQDWVWQGLVTDKLHGTKPGEGILFAAFAPDGKTVALVANWGVQNTSLFKIFTATWAGGQLGTPTPVAPAIRACEVAWRSDSQELVVTQADNCNSGQGAIVRVKLSDPGTVTTLRAAGGQNPTWQPITLQ